MTKQFTPSSLKDSAFDGYVVSTLVGAAMVIAGLLSFATYALI